MNFISNYIFIKWSVHLQASILSNNNYIFRHDNFLGKSLLFILMYLDIYQYNNNRLKFGEDRRKLFGNTFCSLGRIVTVGYDNVINIIEQPNKRSSYIGRIKFNINQFPKQFPLFLDNIENNNNTHSLYHNLIVKYVILGGAEKRIYDNISDKLVNNFINNIRKVTILSDIGKNPIKINGSCFIDFNYNFVEEFLIEWIFYIFLDIRLSNTTKKKAFKLLAVSINGITNKYLADRISGKNDEDLENELIDLISKSNILKDYLVPELDKSFSRHKMSKLILSIITVAGFLGLSNTLLACFSIDIHGKGKFFCKLTKDTDLDNFVLEVIRRFSPVNLVNIKLSKKTNIIIGDKEYTFEKDNIIAYSLLNYSFDPNGPFKNPKEFNIERNSLSKKILNFNSNGLNNNQLLDNRRCPGRFLANKLIVKILKNFINY